MRLRKNRSDAIDGTTGEAGKRRRRSGRGWGPFSGSQLMVIIVTLAIVIGFPVAAFSVTGSSTNIVDPVTAANKAKVDVKGNLYTATRDAVSGTAAKVNSLGQLSVAATGSVTATPTPPSASYTSEAFATESGGACSSITPTVPAGKALIVTSITVSMSSVTTGPVVADLVSATPGSPCGFLSFADGIWISGAKVSQVITIPSGFPVKPGHVLGVEMFSTSGDAAGPFFVHGYLVSSTLCTVSGPPTGCN